MLTDTIGDFLTRVRNASSSRKKYVTVRHSRLIKAIADILLAKRFIESMEEISVDNKKELKITLITDREPLELKRISKPGQRIYVGYGNIKRVRNGLGSGIYSTPGGVISDDEARKQKIGGEYLCEVY